MEDAQHVGMVRRMKRRRNNNTRGEKGENKDAKRHKS